MALQGDGYEKEKAGNGPAFSLLGHFKRRRVTARKYLERYSLAM